MRAAVEAAHVTPELVTVYGSDIGTQAATPERVELATHSLAAILGWVDDRSPGQATVLLDGTTMASMGIPARRTVFRTDDAVLETVVNCGWSWGNTGPWTTFYRGSRDSRVVTVGFLPWITDCPMIRPEDDPRTVVGRFAAWQRLMGSAYRATPGVSAMAVLRDMYDGARREPTWLPAMAGQHRKMVANAETDYTPNYWQRTGTDPHEHGYDARMMYLAAAGVAMLPWYSLANDRSPVRPAGRAGYHLITPAPWHYADLMPDPAGPFRRGTPGDARWVTTATLDLLDDLADQGIHGGYRLHESWTADAGRILRPWADRIRDALRVANRDAADAGRPAGTDPLVITLKQAYREGVGMVGREGGRVYRPEWRHLIIATGRSNLWRKLWRAGRETDRWPLRVDVDCVWYGSASADPADNPPVKLGAELGTFQIKGTLTHKESSHA